MFTIHISNNEYPSSVYDWIFFRNQTVKKALWNREKKNYENKTILQKKRWKKKPSVSHSRAEVNHGCNEKLFSLSLTKI